MSGTESSLERFVRTGGQQQIAKSACGLTEFAEAVGAVVKKVLNEDDPMSILFGNWVVDEFVDGVKTRGYGRFFASGGSRDMTIEVTSDDENFTLNVVRK